MWMSRSYSLTFNCLWDSPVVILGNGISPKWFGSGLVTAIVVPELSTLALTNRLKTRSERVDGKVIFSYNSFLSSIKSSSQIVPQVSGSTSVVSRNSSNRYFNIRLQ